MKSFLSSFDNINIYYFSKTSWKHKRWSKGYTRIKRAVGKVQSIWHRDGYHQNWTVGLKFNILLQHPFLHFKEKIFKATFFLTTTVLLVAAFNGGNFSNPYFNLLKYGKRIRAWIYQHSVSCMIFLITQNFNAQVNFGTRITGNSRIDFLS